MGVLIKNGTLVTALDSMQGDVLCRDGKIAAVGPDLEPTSADEVIDATGQFVFPGGLDPHVHMALPFMGTVSLDDFETGGAAGVAGGTTSFIDFCIPGRGDQPLETIQAWHEKAKRAVCDYTYHLAVTWWSDDWESWLETACVKEGITSVKVFLAYRDAIGIDDTQLVKAMTAAARLGMVVTVHAEHGEMVAELQEQLASAGKLGPKYHLQSRPAPVEGEATHRVLMIARLTGAKTYIVHMTCQEAVQALAEARARGQVAFGETCPQYLVLDASVYDNPNFEEAAAAVMSPPIRPKGHDDILWGAVQSGIIQAIGTDHITFSDEQKRHGAKDFRLIPNGAGGIQDRMSLLYHFGVRTGKLDLNHFVDLTSTRAAKIFDLYPRKGSIQVGADADLVVWDPEGTRTISAKTHFHQNDRSIFEGIEVTGVPSHTIVSGRVAYQDGELRVQPGSGRFLKRVAGKSPSHSSLQGALR